MASASYAGVTDHRGGSTPKYIDGPQDYACVRSSGIQGGYFDWSSTRAVSQDTYIERIKRHAPIVGDVIFCREGARFGNAARVPDGRKICLGQRMMLFQVKTVTATAEYLWALINFNQEMFKAIAGGTAAPRVNIKDIVKLSFMCPPFDLLAGYSEIVERVDEMKTKHDIAHQVDYQLFNSLVQRAFRGEL